MSNYTIYVIACCFVGLISHFFNKRAKSVNTKKMIRNVSGGVICLLIIGFVIMEQYPSSAILFVTLSCLLVWLIGYRFTQHCPKCGEEIFGFSKENFCSKCGVSLKKENEIV